MLKERTLTHSIHLAVKELEITFAGYAGNFPVASETFWTFLPVGDLTVAALLLDHAIYLPNEYITIEKLR